jgi:hypothetical protein
LVVIGRCFRRHVTAEAGKAGKTLYLTAYLINR